MKFMKSLSPVLLGVAVAAATLSSVAPADALGGCGRHGLLHGRDAVRSQLTHRWASRFGA